MKFNLIMSVVLVALLFSLSFLILVPNSNKAFAQNDVFLKSITRISGGSIFNAPLSVALDPSENVYVADSNNYRIAKLSNSGTFITALGTAGQGELNTTSGVAVDSSGNVYASDFDRNLVIEFNSSGSFVKSFGSGTLSSPSGVAVDSSGNVYVADTGNNQIVEFSNSGTTLQSFGSGTLSSPSGVAVDSSGNVYVADTGNNQIVEFSNSGGFIQSFGTPGTLLLSLPANVALNGTGDIFVADQGNDRIAVFDNMGNFLFSFGIHGSGNGQFNKPFGIAFDSSGNIYVVDTGNNRVEKFDSTGNFILSFGSIGTGGGLFEQPLGIAIGNSGNIFVADTNNHRISKFSSSGSYIQSFGSGTLSKPSGVVFNAAGNFYVSDRGNNVVYEFNSTIGSLIGTFPNSNSGGITFSIPYGIGFDFPGNLHVVDSGHSRVVVLSSTGQNIAQFGFPGSENGNFSIPSGLAIDASGNIYVADTGNNRVEIFSPTVPPATTITLNNPTPSSVRWGIDSVSISGHATSIPTGSTITINWGDGNTTPNIPVSTFTGNWGPVTHTYPAATSGQTEQIVGTVNNGNTVLATSSPVSVMVIPHHTSITIGNIPNVPFGGQVTASGILTDTDAGIGISNIPISFSGNGIVSMPPATTASGGSYSSTGTATSSISSGLQVTATFVGNSQYLPSTATSSTFSTLQHHAILYLTPIPNSPWGGLITISGTLNDTDAGNVGVNGKSITITGSGVTSSQTVTTSTISGKAGSFSTTANAPNSVATGLSVTATFAGDSNYIGNSISTSYNTIAHRTSLTLNPISNIIAGGTIIASGILKDTDANAGLVGSTITFNGTGLGTIGSTSTAVGGAYSSQGTAPNNVLSGLRLQAHYSGSQLYQNADSIIQTYSTGNAPAVSINAPVIPNTLGNNQARWGIDPVTINGTVSNAVNGDTITITWGDSSSVNNIPINSGKWGPLTHTYGPGAVGTNHILATLISSTNVNKTISAPLSIFVIQHKAVITLNPVSNVGAGGTLTVTGRLTDADVNTGISGEPVIFNGTGVGTLATVGTNSTGYYTATGTAPNTITNGLTLQARFTGDLDIFPASSAIQTYNTLAITSPPEGFNQFDPVSKDVLVYGIDSTGKIFGPIKPTSVTKTVWDADDDQGGDHSKSGDQGKGDDKSKSDDQGRNGDHSRIIFQNYAGNSQILFQKYDDKSKPGKEGKDDDHSKSGNKGGDDDHQYYPGNDHDFDGKQAELRTFNIVDSAGNSLVLTEKVVKSNNQINVHVISMQYNNGKVMPAPINLKHFSWSLDKKNNVQELDQAMIVGKFILPTIFVHAEFSQGNNQTHIEVIQFGQHPQHIIKNGLDLLKMLTANGSLTIQY